MSEQLVLAPVPQRLGYAPGSVYSAWTSEQQAAAGRIEVEVNHRRRARLALGFSDAGHPIRGLTDAGLRRLAKHHRRDIEDIVSGDLVGGSRRRRLAAVELRDVEREQEFRAVLAECWLAREDGTHSYTMFHARGGLLAVLDHGAPPPSYELAVMLDRDMWRHGQPCVLAWETPPSTGEDERA